MRMTLSIDDDVLAAAKALAMAERKTVGEVISALARRGLRLAETRNGVPLLAVRSNIPSVTSEFVRQLREELN